MIELATYVIAILVAALCLVIHFEAMKLFYRSPVVERLRHGVVLLLLGLLVAHGVEIWLFALAYSVLADTAFGHIEHAVTFFDYVYFSASSYTTLGIGDLFPAGTLRALAASEAVVGLVLIAWSAALAFLQMQRLWDRSP